MITKYTSEAALDFHTGKDEGTFITRSLQILLQWPDQSSTKSGQLKSLSRSLRPWSASTAPTVRSGGSLIADAHGDLFGTTASQAGRTTIGTVFEIAKTAHGYASTPTTLVSFNGTNGADPHGSLIADANGDLFGTTASAGGANGARHGVRDRQDRPRLRQHPHHPGQLQRHQRCPSDRQPDRRRQRRPVRHDSQ